jgi:hypothetical protein
MAIIIIFLSFPLLKLNFEFTLQELFLDQDIMVLLIEDFQHFLGLGFGVHGKNFSFLGVFVLAKDSVFTDYFFALDCSPDFILDLLFLF